MKSLNEDWKDYEEDISEKDALFMQKVGEALRRHEKKTRLSEEVVEGWVFAAEQRRRLRRRRMAAIAACIMLFFGGVVTAASWLVPDDVVAGKTGEVTKEEGNNTIVKEGEGQYGENTGTERITVDDWDKIATVKKKYPQLLIPQYIPEGFAFVKLQVEANELAQVYTYTYGLDNEKILIVQTSDNDFTMIKEFDRILKSEKELEIKVKEDEGKCGYVIIGEYLCVIMGDLSDDEYEKVADDLAR